MPAAGSAGRAVPRTLRVNSRAHGTAEPRRRRRHLPSPGEPVTCGECQRFRSAASYRKPSSDEGGRRRPDRTPAGCACAVAPGRNRSPDRNGEGPRLRTGPGAAERIERVMTTTETELKISEEPLAGVRRADRGRAEQSGAGAQKAKQVRAGAGLQFLALPKRVHFTTALGTSRCVDAAPARPRARRGRRRGSGRRSRRPSSPRRPAERPLLPPRAGDELTS